MDNNEEDPKLLQGADLDPYKIAPLETCWWCGSSDALTREHKFKRSDLDRMAGTEGLVWGSDGTQRAVRSTRKSQPVRFDPSLCARCNNERSQPFDIAYQEFSDFVWGTPPAWRRHFLDLALIYGDDWESRSLDLARYFAKHLGCRLAHDNFPVPPSLGEFMSGRTAVLHDVQMVLFKSHGHYKLYKLGLRDGVDARGLWISPATGDVSPSRQCLTMYSSGVVVNYTGVYYRWQQDCKGVDPFYLHRRARLHDRSRLPQA